MFDQKQIAEFKEAFSMIDHDNDGFIDHEDLKEILSSLGGINLGYFCGRNFLGSDKSQLSTHVVPGSNPTDEQIASMLADAPGPINFTLFLTLLGEKMSGTDPEHEILQAFESFDEKKTGIIDGEMFREFITTMGDRFTDDEVDSKPDPGFFGSLKS